MKKLLSVLLAAVLLLSFAASAASMYDEILNVVRSQGSISMTGFTGKGVKLSKKGDPSKKIGLIDYSSSATPDTFALVAIKDGKILTGYMLYKDQSNCMKNDHGYTIENRETVLDITVKNGKITKIVVSQIDISGIAGTYCISVPSTGDSTNVALLTALMLLGAAGILLSIRRSRA